MLNSSQYYAQRLVACYSGGQNSNSLSFQFSKLINIPKPLVSAPNPRHCCKPLLGPVFFFHSAFHSSEKMDFNFRLSSKLRKIDFQFHSVQLFNSTDFRVFLSILICSTNPFFILETLKLLN